MSGRDVRRHGGVIGSCTRGRRLRRGTVVLVALCAGAGAGAIRWDLAFGNPGGALVSAAPPGAPTQADSRSRVEVVWSHPGSAPTSVARTRSDQSADRSAADTPSQAYRDPESGRWTAPPAEEVERFGPQRLSAAISTSAEGLLEEPVTGPRGGVRVSLRGRFRSALVAERDAAGHVRVGCGTPAGVDSTTASGDQCSAVLVSGERAEGGGR